MLQAIAATLIFGIFSTYQPILAQNTDNKTIEINEPVASFSLPLKEQNLKTADDLYCFAEESSNSDDKNETAANLEKSVKFFLNPWLGVSENLLAEFLSQNWFLYQNLAQRRELLLAIAREEKKDPRKFRRETELLLRDPGICQIYSYMTIFPRLLLTDVSGFEQFIDSLAAKIIKDEITAKQAIAYLKARLQLSFKLLDTFIQLTDQVNKVLNSFKTISNRKTRISNIHNLIRKQNSQMIENLGLQQQKIQQITSQHRLQLENALLQYQYLLENIDMNRVLIASRLKRFKGIIGDTHQNLHNYFNKFTFFTLKLKENVAQFLADSEQLAQQIDKNRFHIINALHKFPQRDLNPQKTESFKFSSMLKLICAYLDNQLQIFREINKSKQPIETNFRDEFLQVLDKFNNDFYASKNFEELFSEIYKDECSLQQTKLRSSENLLQETEDF